MTRLRIVVADDERPARLFLSALLRTFDDVVVVGEAASGREAVTLIEQERPHLALLDLQMPELEEILIDVWRQALVDGAKYVQLGDEKYPVRETSRRRLKQVDFRFEDKELRGLEQNPNTKSKWAAMARDGHVFYRSANGVWLTDEVPAEYLML